MELFFTDSEIIQECPHSCRTNNRKKKQQPPHNRISDSTSKNIKIL